MKKVRKTNPELLRLIEKAKELAIKNESKFWKRVAKELMKPNRRRRVVNLGKVNRYTKKGEVVLVLGKLLSMGELKHPLTISAFSCSEAAREKLKKAKAKYVELEKFMKLYPEGKGVKLLG
ncbi:50S ribosomal protein L18e [Nanoarchaeota archaeon]|nr:MAG: 50S ribosomal protein L18e [Nanoarchaeota archaeon]